MELYQKAYLFLFNAITDALSELEAMNLGLLKDKLIESQQQAEEIFLAEPEFPQGGINESAAPWI